MPYYNVVIAYLEAVLLRSVTSTTKKCMKDSASSYHTMSNPQNYKEKRLAEFDEFLTEYGVEGIPRRALKVFLTNTLIDCSTIASAAAVAGERLKGYLNGLTVVETQAELFPDASALEIVHKLRRLSETVASVPPPSTSEQNKTV